MKEAAVYIRKFILFALQSAQGFACRQPFVAGFIFSSILLHTFYPNLFAFLVTSSPVLLCTALLLGTLLWYGEPYIPEIEEEEAEDELNLEVSSLKVERSLDDLLLKKDKNYTLEGIAGSTDSRNERLSDFLAEEQDKFGEDFILEREFEENVGDLMKELPECQSGTREVADGVSKGVESFTMAINEPELDEWLESSLGSPCHPINIHVAASDSESDRAESSSPDASMADILPMLNELQPRLDSKAPKFADNSDAEICKHHESDEDSTEQEDERKSEESGASNKVVTWTADDQKNVMDLGSSDQERNRRLESLIARRRARKNQIIIFERDLIDFQSNDMTVDELHRFHPQIRHIFAPRRNPFDIHHDSDESEGYPPIPGSAPSVLLHGKNPFDCSYDTENGDNQGLAEDISGQPESGLPSRSGLPFRRYESFASRSSRLKPCFVGETRDLKHNDVAGFEPDEETHQSADDSDNFKKEIEGTLVVEEKHEVVVEEKGEEWTLFTSSEDNEKKTLDVIFPGEIEIRGKITTFIEGKSQASVPIYDFSTSGSGNFFADIYMPDDTLFSSGRGVPNSTSPVESHVQEGIMGAVSHERAFGQGMTSELMEFEVVHGSKLPDSTSSNGEQVTFTSNINLLDEDMFQSKRVSEAGGEDFMENRSPAYEDLDHSSGFTSRKAESNFAFYNVFPPSNVEEQHQSLEKLTSFGILLEESQISNLELGPILEENLEDFMVEEEQVDFLKATVTPSTGPRILDDPNICKFSVGEKAVSLHNQSKEAAGDDGNEEEVALFPEKSKPSKNSNIFDSIEYLNLYKMKPDYEFKSNEGMNDAQAIDINEFQINQDAILMNLNDFYDVPGDENADVREIQWFEEQFLSELDAVGDFHMESQSPRQLDCSSKDSELVLNQKNPKDSGFWSSARSHGDDLELTVYKPKLSVLQSCSLEEFDSTFVENSPGEFAEISVSEAITCNFEPEKPHGELSRSEMSGQGIEAVTLDATLLTPNETSVGAKTIEDACSAFNHASETIHSKSLVNPESSNSPEDFKQMNSSSSDTENSSVLSVLEAKSSEDMRLAFQLATKGEPYEDMDSTFEQFDNEKMLTGSNAELETDLTGPINSENDAKPVAFERMTVDVTSDFEQARTTSLESRSVNEVVDVCCLERQIDPEPSVLDAKSAEDTRVIPSLEQEADAAEKISISAEYEPGMFAPESFEDTHLEFREAAADDFCQTNTILFDPERKQGQEVLVEKSPDSGNDSDTHVTEAKSLEDFNLPFKQSTEDYDTVKECHFASVAEEKYTVNIHTTFSAGVYEGSPSFSAETRPCDEVENDSGILIMESKTLHDINSNCELATNVRSFDTESVPNSLVTEEDYARLADSSLKQVSEEGNAKPILSIDPPVLQVNKDKFMEENSLGKNDSELLVIKENSVKDMDSTFKQATGEPLGGSVSLQDDSKTETHSELAKMNVEVFDEMVIGQKNSNEEQMNTIIDEKEIVSEDPSSSPPTWLNTKKFEKENENKSDSSSSSSDSE
ncbi:hypothetical protein KSP40_PGU009808 [Platanthera guangdongensis]|uniref:Uncharacterized protein n=1 Tax=Platanthera guangdongensis TaxID=2320717 RepID=A0ABR2MTZ6_9ASPA